MKILLVKIDWCAILIAHQLLWRNMDAPVPIFQESPLAGEPCERLFYIRRVHRYQICTKYLYPSALLWQKTAATFHNKLVYFTGAIFFVVENLSTFNKISEFSARPAKLRGTLLALRAGLQKYYKFKFKYFIASYTWQGAHRGLCNKVSHTHMKT